MFKPSDEESDITALSPFASGYKEIDGKTTTYICTNYECKKPVNDAEELIKLIHELT